MSRKKLTPRVNYMSALPLPPVSIEFQVNISETLSRIFHAVLQIEIPPVVSAKWSLLLGSKRKLLRLRRFLRSSNFLRTILGFEYISIRNCERGQT